MPVDPAAAGWDAFTRLFDARLRDDRIVGAGVLLLRDGGVLAHHEYGFADRERGQRVDEQTLFHYGSITKTLTAIAVLQLRDRGRLSLDDPVTHYLPELRLVHDPYGAMDRISLRMLLSHSAGFQEPTWPYRQGKPWEPFEPTTWAQLVAMMPYQELHFEPGSRYGYSNPAFIYLARIVEQCSGDPWEVYVQKNVFAPLGLTRSYFGSTPYHLTEHRSNSYTIRRDASGRTTVSENGREFDPGVTIPNGGWNAPLTDLATYLAFLTGATHGDPTTRRLHDTVLRRASLEEMWQPLFPTADASEWMGLSFFVRRTGEATLIGHAGEQAGFVAFLYFNPATTGATVVALNTDNTLTRDTAISAVTTLREAALRLIS